MKRRVIASITALFLGMSPISTFAADIDAMTLEELKEAYIQLESEKEDLEAEVKDLKVQLFDLQSGAGTEETDQETEVETEVVETVLMTTEDFLNDFKESYVNRDITGNKYTEAETGSMTSEEYNAFLSEVAGAERPFYEKYKNAIFDDLNIQYLCQQYIQGLSKQYQACEEWETDPDSEHATTTWQSGYYNRAYVMVELSEYYGLDLPAGAIAAMKEDTTAMDSLNEAETRNSAVDHETVRKTQELLNGIGFFCGTADGISGKRTVKSIKRFQEMYGYEPIDGMIDDELIEQLQAEYDKKNPADEELTTETSEP